MNVRVRVVKVGNSRGVLIPAVIMKGLGWKVGTLLDLDSDEEGRVELRPKQKKEKR